MITPEDVRTAIADFPNRLLALAQAKGRHFEYTFKKFKRDRYGAKPCPSCNEFHICDCPDCDWYCMTTRLRHMGICPPTGDDMNRDMTVD